VRENAGGGISVYEEQQRFRVGDQQQGKPLIKYRAGSGV